jgi:HEPN domain-containing protein
MRSEQEVAYRLKLAQGFLTECRQDVALKRWRSAVDNGQLAIEHAAKAVLATIGPVGRTHNPAILLQQALQDNRFANTLHGQVRRLAELARLMGLDVHIRTDYGIEAEMRTPWDLFKEMDATQALKMAEEAVSLAQQIWSNLVNE